MQQNNDMILVFLIGLLYKRSASPYYNVDTNNTGGT